LGLNDEKKKLFEQNNGFPNWRVTHGWHRQCIEPKFLTILSVTTTLLNHDIGVDDKVFIGFLTIILSENQETWLIVLVWLFF